MRYIKDDKLYDEVAYVVIDDMTVINPTKEQILNAGYSIYNTPKGSQIPLSERIERARDEKLASLDDYDRSSEVNEFFIGDASVWFDKETRRSLKMRFEAEESIGRTETSLWCDDVCYTLSISTAKILLNLLEVYAADCYDTTLRHRSKIMSINTLSGLSKYDYKIGYPEKIHFEYGESDGGSE